MNTTTQIARFVRWREWAPLTFALVWGFSLYIAVAYDLTVDRFALTFVVFSVFAFSQASYAYILNDWGDREIDRRQFKPNAFNGLTSLECMLALTLATIITFVSGTALMWRPGFAVLWAAWAACAAALSLKPFRLKERGLVGLFVSVTAQYFLPVLLAFSAFEVSGGWDMWVLATAYSVHGIALEIGRQRHNRIRSVYAQAKTFAAELGNQQINRLYAVMLLLDKIAVGAMVGVIVHRLGSLHSSLPTSLAIVLAVAFVSLFLVTLDEAVKNIVNGTGDDPYYAASHPLTRVLHQNLLDFVIPVVLGLVAVSRTPLYGLFLGLFFLGRVAWLGANMQFPISFQNWAREMIRRRDNHG